MTRAILAAMLVALAVFPIFGATDAKAYSQTGIASYYWQGKRTANGESYKPDGISAAHKTLPFGTRVKVTHLGTGRSIVVRINDRGPFIKGRIIDLSRGAAGVLGIKGSGVARVRIEVVGSVKSSKKAKTRKASKKSYATNAVTKKNKKKAKSAAVNTTAVSSKTVKTKTVKTKSAKANAAPKLAAFVAPAAEKNLNLMSYQKIAKKK
ncbi:MAG: septal ring lytic transglycosylase RlpA family protein [Hyphomicrobiaceae bacterium]